jgi:hypothetical protein
LDGKIIPRVDQYFAGWDDYYGSFPNLTAQKNFKYSIYNPPETLNDPTREKHGIWSWAESDLPYSYQTVTVYKSILDLHGTTMYRSEYDKLQNEKEIPLNAVKNLSKDCYEPLRKQE